MTVEKSINRSGLHVLTYTLLVACFLLFGIRENLAADLAEGKIESIVVRLSFVVFVSLFIAFRLRKTQITGPKGCFQELSIILIFLVFLYYPLVSQFSYLGKSIEDTKHGISRNHNAKIDKILALLKEFPSEYEKYMDKHFNFSKQFVHLDALVKVYGLGVSPNNSVAVGKNGFYFEGWGARKVEKGIVENFDNIADYMGQIPFTEEELQQWKRTLEERKYWLREKGSEYVFVLAPTKALVYPEYLPTSLQRAVNSGEGVTRYAQLTDYLQKNADIHFVDVLPSLLEVKQKREYPLLFYKTDFHWNFYGAFVAYQAIMEELKKIFPEYSLSQPKITDFDLSIDKHWAHHRFMNMVGLPMSLHKNEHYITMVPKRGGRWDSALDLPPGGIKDAYPPESVITAENGNTLKIRLIRNPDAPIPSILLLGDSFFEKCVYFFSADGQKVLNFRTIVNFPNTIFDFEQPSIVIQEILNMFLLREPPKNPPGFAISYLKGKFDDSRDTVLVNKTGPFLQEDDGSFNIALPVGNNAEKGEVRILKMSLIGKKKGKVKIRFLRTDGKEADLRNMKFLKGLNRLYVELPSFPVAGVIISEGNVSGKTFVLEDLEVRSDRAVMSK